MKEYVARQGDIVWLDFSPQTGHEQAGRRPAAVISNSTANRVLNTRVIVVPISNTNKGIPIQPQLDGRTTVQGVLLCDQVRAVDLVARKAVFIEELPQDLLFEVVDIVYGMIEFIKE